MDELRELTLSYRPNDSVVDLVRSTRIILLVGISGAGKDTIKHAIAQKASFSQIISHTTRLPRINGGVHEVDGVDYHFIDIAKAVKMLKNHEFIEAKLVHGDTVYGTAVAEFEKANQHQQTAIGDIDIKGVDEYLQLSDHVKAIFVVPPSYEIWVDRLKKRYASKKQFDSEWTKRRVSAKDELTATIDRPDYHFIINDKLERTVELVDQILYEPSLIVYDDSDARKVAREILKQLEAEA